MTTTPALTALSHALAELSTLSRRDLDTQRFSDWQTYTLNALSTLLGPNAPAVAEFGAIVFAPPPPASLAESEALWRAGKARAGRLLTSARFQPYSTPAPNA